MYVPRAMPAKHRLLPDGHIIVTGTAGDFAFFDSEEFDRFLASPQKLDLRKQADLRARFLLTDGAMSRGMQRLLASRIAAKRETVTAGPSLHIIVPTLQCAHSCQYCQVSRSLDDEGHTMSLSDLNAACDTILESKSDQLTIEFQGGDPLLRFDLVKHAILRIREGAAANRRIRFVVASTLHQLDDAMCSFFKEHSVYMSTSLDGPRALHNANRPTPSRNAYERTLAGIQIAREKIGVDAVAALMTTTKASLAFPEEIVDEYVRQGFREIFLRPLSSYGFAKRNQNLLGYSVHDFLNFYRRGLDRIMYWSQRGVELREVYASILLNKMLSTFDAGYVDLQSPTGAGSSVLVYNYDGFVYPSDEARMLAETGDRSLRMGRIGESLDELLNSPVRQQLVEACDVRFMSDCRDCAYNLYCSPNPVDAQAQHGTMTVAAGATEHCQRHMALFDAMFSTLRAADEDTSALLHEWAQVRESCANA